MTFSGVIVGIREARATLASGSLRLVTFSGKRSITVRAGTKALSDSITDNVYPNYLARRLNDHPIPKAVVNVDIGGNRVLHDSPRTPDTVKAQ